MARIINFSESLLIGLHSLILLVKMSPKPVNTKCIAQKTGASENTISKVMQRLVKEKLIRSTRGPAGGFELAKAAAEISFLEIFEAIEGKMETTGCPFNSKVCSFDQCIFENYVHKISNEVMEYFKNKTLMEYMESGHMA